MNDYQKAQREKTIAAAIEAATRLQAKGVNLTFRAIAEEADLSVSTVARDDIKMILYRDFSMGKKRGTGCGDVNNLQKELNRMREKLKHSQKVNNQLRAKNKILQEERDKIDLQYRNLLMQYAINIDKKIMPL